MAEATLPPESAGEYRRRLLIASFVMLGLGVVVGYATRPLDSWRVFGGALTSLLFGALVGLSEILSRYRDEPILASTTSFGLVYLLLNGLISLAAFLVLCRYSTKVFPVINGDLFLTAIVAGFGGMTVFRSKLFTFRSSDGKEYAIGPSIVLETILKTIDHKIDRRRATERQAKVFTAMSDLKDFENTAKYIEGSLNSFQNLTKEEKIEITDVIDQYRKLTWPERLKIMAMGYAFLNIAGEENFDEVMKNLKKFLLSLSPSAPSASPTSTPPTTPQDKQVI